MAWDMIGQLSSHGVESLLENELCPPSEPELPSWRSGPDEVTTGYTKWMGRYEDTGAVARWFQSQGLLCVRFGLKLLFQIGKQARGSQMAAAFQLPLELVDLAKMRGDYAWNYVPGDAQVCINRSTCVLL